MEKKRYAVYPPPEPGLPFLAVVLDEDGPSIMFGCPDREAATNMLTKFRQGSEARENAQGS
jgi:L-2-hydroxyglutarate oxidase LhgO